MKGVIVFKTLINISYEILLLLILSVELLSFDIHEEVPYAFKITEVEVIVSFILWKLLEYYFLEDDNRHGHR